jgi:hypothetical protein
MEKMKQAIGPLLVGIVCGMLLLSFGFGFVSGGTVAEAAADAAEEASVAALVPFCVANAQADEATLTEVMAKSSFQRRAEVSKAGWAIYPDAASSSLKRSIDQGCIDALSATS